MEQAKYNASIVNILAWLKNVYKTANMLHSTLGDILIMLFDHLCCHQCFAVTFGIENPNRLQKYSAVVSFAVWSRCAQHVWTHAVLRQSLWIYIDQCIYRSSYVRQLSDRISSLEKRIVFDSTTGAYTTPSSLQAQLGELNVEAKKCCTIIRNINIDIRHIYEQYGCSSEMITAVIDTVNSTLPSTMRSESYVLSALNRSTINYIR